MERFATYSFASAFDALNKKSELSNELGEVSNDRLRSSNTEGKRDLDVDNDWFVVELN